MLKFSDYVWVKPEDVRMVRIETQGAAWVVKLLFYGEGHVETNFGSRDAAAAHADSVAREIRRKCSDAATSAKTPLHERRAQAASMAPRIVRTATKAMPRSAQQTSQFADNHFRRSAERMARTADGATRNSAALIAAASFAGFMDEDRGQET